MAAATKNKRKEEAYPWKAGNSSRHKTNLKQSILETFDIYVVNKHVLKRLAKKLFSTHYRRMTILTKFSFLHSNRGLYLKTFYGCICCHIKLK
jgi:hypothetical protein